MRGKYYEFGAGDCTGAQRYAQSAHSGKVVQCLLAPPPTLPTTVMVWPCAHTGGDCC